MQNLSKINLRLWKALFLMACILSACSPRVQQAEKSSMADVRQQVEIKPTSRSRQVHIDAPLIILDPGHGGDDEGASSKPLRYQEKQLALQTAKFVRQYLESMGYRVAMTRCRDEFIPLEKRASFANESKSALFVSLHYNSAKNKEAKGVEIHYFDSAQQPKRSQSSKKLAQSVLEQIVKATGAKSRGVKASNFAVIRLTDMAAILVEGGFLTNSEERKQLKSPFYLQSLALSIAEGIDHYLKIKQP